MANSNVDTVTPLPQRKLTVAVDADIRSLLPRDRAYRATVIGIPGLRLVITPSGAKTWETVVRDINKVIRTFGHGSWPHVSIKQAIKESGLAYTDAKSGVSRANKKRVQGARARDVSEAGLPIVEHCRDWLQRALASGRVSDGYNDQLAIRWLGDAVGKVSFADFTAEDADRIRDKYAGLTNVSKLEKTSKMIKKVFNSLPSTVIEEVRKDVPRMVDSSVGKIPKRTRADQFFDSSALGALWLRLVAGHRSPPHQIHTDILVFCLLSGERVGAVRNIRKENIYLGRGDQYIFAEGKRSDGTSTKNVIPLTPMLGVFVQRLLRQSEAIKPKSEYLFPGSGRTDAPISTINRDYVRSLGSINGVKVGCHNLRRTIANAAASALGDINKADAHILHFTGMVSGSKAHYLDPRSRDFLEARRPTFVAAHRYLDDAILAACSPVGVLETPDRKPVTIDSGPVAAGLVLHDAEYCAIQPFDVSESQGLQVVSPLGTYCAGRPVVVNLSAASRPRAYAKAQHSLALTAEFTARSPTDFVSEIS